MSALPESPIVLISGCSSGIGRALAERFHASGCQVWATARDPARLADLAGQGMRTHALDVTDADSVAACVAAVEAEHGAVDVLINNAGIPVMGPTAEVSLDDLQAIWDTNLTGVVALSQAVIPKMVARGAGRIVNIGSVSGILTTPFAGPYCASKAALHHLNDALRMELTPFGLDVLLIQPGGIASGFGDAASRQTEAGQWQLYARYRDGIARRAGASQEQSTPAADFARDCAAAVLAARPRPVTRIGAGSGLLPRLARLPVRVKDRLLMRRFGLR